MDMRSITDRAAQTLLWTELFRGESRSWLEASMGGTNPSQPSHARPPVRSAGCQPPRKRALTLPSLFSRPGHDAELPFPGAGHH